MRKVILALVAVVFIVGTVAQGGFMDRFKKKEAPAVCNEIGFVAVESSLIKAVKYDEASKILIVKFVEGEVYEYSDVSKKAYDGLMGADSKGNYFRTKIRDEYESVKK